MRRDKVRDALSRTSQKGGGMNILWVSNYLSNSAYAIQSRYFVHALIHMDHRVTVLPIGSSYLHMMDTAPDGVPLVTVGNHILGHDVVEYHYNRLQCDLVITFTDVWALPPDIYKHMNWFPITPIDMPLSPDVRNSLSVAKFPIVISQYGKRQIELAGLEFPQMPYLPMIVDDKFQPTNNPVSWGNIDSKRFLVAFVGVNDTNPSRKGIPELLQAWAQFLKRSKADAHLYMHTHVTGNLDKDWVGGGVDIPQICRTLGLEPGENGHVSVPLREQYRTGFPQQTLIDLAQRANLLVIPSRREGVCIPVLEFQACGCPVIGVKGHAQEEFIFRGQKVRTQPSWGLHGHWEQVVDVPELVKAIQGEYVKFKKQNTFPIAKQIEQFRPDYVLGTVLPGIMGQIATYLLSEVTDEN
jgi:glycosyltransferase involved in cell wall biosynthesis